MTVIGFNFTKIHAQKHNALKGQITINRTCKPTSVEEIDISAGQKGLRYEFIFGVEYEPKIAELQLEGSIIELVSDEERTTVMSAWTEKKQIPAKSIERVLNNILDRCHVEAIIISKELNIPPPIKLPSVTVKEGSQNQEQNMSDTEEN